MNVGLWAEIRRLTEIDKLSGRAIAQRLHCSRHTVAAALKLQQPPAQTSSGVNCSSTAARDCARRLLRRLSPQRDSLASKAAVWLRSFPSPSGRALVSVVVADTGS